MRKVCLYWLSVVTLVLFILLLYFHEVFDIVVWNKRVTCGSKATGRPFYFGTTNLECMRRIKRSLVKYELPKRKYWTLTHRWISFQGWYFELFYLPRIKKPAKVPPCSFEREAKPAGYTFLDVGCVRRCAMYYNVRFEASYNPFIYNCHHFANKLAEIMCTFSRCPDWCDDYFENNYNEDVIVTKNTSLEKSATVTSRVSV